MQNIAIVGAGLVGRVLALFLVQKNYNITLFDEDNEKGELSAGITAAGMLAPFAELETAESIIFEKGKKSIELWKPLLEQINLNDGLQKKGSIITAHPQDYGELDHFINLLKSKVKDASKIEALDREKIKELEPDLEQHSKAFYLPLEGQVDAQRFMEYSTKYLLNHPNISWHIEKKVEDISSYNVEGKTFDWVFDSRGLGSNMKGLRGVRGEVLWLDAPEVNISRPTRILHPRYKIYIVPRAKNRYIIGATEIESEDKSPVSVRSALELLSAVFTVHSGFGEARIVKMTTNCRPALKDNLPKIEKEKGLTKINGLYRHGYLLAPAIVEEALGDFL